MHQTCKILIPIDILKSIDTENKDGIINDNQG
jgi:hypothetical protein